MERLFCWRASFFALVRKLFALPAFGVSDRMRPGRGSNRLSSSWLMGRPRPGCAGQGRNSGRGATTIRARSGACAHTRHWEVANGVPHPLPETSVQTRVCPETGALGCRFPLSCPPPFLPFALLPPGSQPGVSRPDRPAKRTWPLPESRPSRCIPSTGPRDEYPLGWRISPCGFLQHFGQRTRSGSLHEQCGVAPVWWR